MNSRERIKVAMRLKEPDRVPVMCQLAIGHYFLNTDIPNLDIWYDSRGFAEALVSLQWQYGFDGILVNLPGRDPNWRDNIRRIDDKDQYSIIHWKNGDSSRCPIDDNVQHNYLNDTRPRSLADIEPDGLFYIDAHDMSGIKYPFYYGFEPKPLDRESFFPEYILDTIRMVRKKAGPEVSVHGEVFSPFTQFMDLMNYENALMALHEDEGRVLAILDNLADGAGFLGSLQAGAGVDAVLISSAFAGAGFISPGMYEKFVLPFEKKVITTIKSKYKVPVYTHTCGSIGDRLELMEATGTDGIDTLDPPPLGDVELEDAKERVGGRMFIKGNMDAVNTLLNGTPEQVRADAAERVRIGKPGGGYILSSACSVAPRVPPEHLHILREVVEEEGWY
jgi:Uroporphyrinogen decarboxylase (URO-D)